MSKLKKCKSCNHEVASGAKICPNCGAKLKMGMMLKLLIAVVTIIVAATYFGMSPEEKTAQLTETLNKIESAPVSDLSPRGNLAAHFHYGSDHTDIQRENLLKEITGQIVQWKLEIYEISGNEEKNRYRLQTSGGANVVGTFVTVHIRNDAEISYIESLKTGDIVQIKGRITGTTMRNIDINDAIIIR